MTLAMSGATPSDAGLASGLVNTSMQVGGAIGLALLATLSTQRHRTLIDSGAGHASALNSGFHLAYLLGAGLAAVAVAIAVLRAAAAGAAGDPASAGGRAGLFRGSLARPVRPDPFRPPSEWVEFGPGS